MSHQFRRGDVISAKGVVCFDHNEDARFISYRPNNEPESGPIYSANVADVELIHHGFSPGDLVTYAFDHLGHTFERQGVIEAICGDVAWVKRTPVNFINDDGGFSTIALADLKPAADAATEQVSA